MQIVKQSYEIWSDKQRLDSDYRMIERAARVAYKSEGQMSTDQSGNMSFLDTRMRGKHYPIFEFGDLVVLFTTDRGVSHELVRHRHCSFVQESTRYCNYGKHKFDNQVTFIKPFCINDSELVAFLSEAKLSDWHNHWKGLSPAQRWYQTCSLLEEQYLELLQSGWSPQEARSVLPNSLKTEIVVKADFVEWRHIFRLRAISAAAHPQMRALMIPLYEEMRKRYSVIFDMGDVE